MINLYNAKRFCREDISLIENYKEAISDKYKTWDIHHRRECDENEDTVFSTNRNLSAFFKTQIKTILTTILAGKYKPGFQAQVRDA